MSHRDLGSNITLPVSDLRRLRSLPMLLCETGIVIGPISSIVRVKIDHIYKMLSAWHILNTEGI